MSGGRAEPGPGEVLRPRGVLRVSQAWGWEWLEGMRGGLRVCACACMFVRACMHVCAGVFVCVHVCACMHVYACVRAPACGRQWGPQRFRLQTRPGILSGSLLASPRPSSFILTPCLSFLLCQLIAPTLQGCLLGVNGPHRRRRESPATRAGSQQTLSGNTVTDVIS